MRQNEIALVFLGSGLLVHVLQPAMMMGSVPWPWLLLAPHVLSSLLCWMGFGFYRGPAIVRWALFMPVVIGTTMIAGLLLFTIAGI